MKGGSVRRSVQPRRDGSPGRGVARWPPARIAAHQLIAFAMDLHLASAAPGVRRRTGSAAPDRDDPEPVAHGVLDQDRHELAGRVTGVPGVGLLRDALHVTAEASMLNCAESRCTTWAIATTSAPEAGINYQLTGRHDPVNPASGDHPYRKTTRTNTHTATISPPGAT